MISSDTQATTYQRNMSIPQQLAHEIGRSIVAGRFSHLDTLPSDAEFGELYGVSRNVVREAFCFLRSKNMLKRRQCHGTLITPEKNWDLLDSDVLNWLFQRKVSKELIKELWEIRLTIEPQAASIASQTFNSNNNLRLDGIKSDIDCLESSFEKELSVITRFHIEVLNQTGNRFYSQFSHLIKTALQYTYSTLSIKTFTPFTSTDLYGDVVQAIKQKESHQACISMRKLISHQMEFLDSNVNA